MINNSFDSAPWHGNIEVSERAHRYARMLQIGQELSVVDGRQRLNGFELYYQLILNNHIQAIAAIELNSLIGNWQRTLTLKSNARQPQLMTQAFFAS